MSRGTWLVTPDKFLGAEQVARLRDHLDRQRQVGLDAADKKAVRDAAIVEVLLGTGLRVSEVCDLVVGDVFLEAANVLVRRGKGNKARLVAIPKKLAGYITEFIAWKTSVGEDINGNAPLFVSQRRDHLSRSGVHRIWKAALTAAGLPTTWGVRATRHSYATELYRRTRDLRHAHAQLLPTKPARAAQALEPVDELQLGVVVERRQRRQLASLLERTANVLVAGGAAEP